MRRLVLAFAVGAAVGVAVTATVFLPRPRPSWQEQEARSTAHTLACDIAQVGLGARPCGEVLSFRRTAPNTYEARISATRRTYCFRLQAPLPPQRCAARA